MTLTVRKIPILRYALIVSLIVVLFSSAFYLYLYYSKAVKLRNNVHQMVLARESAAKIDSCLIYLYNADNSSRLYALTADKKYFVQFSKEIEFVNGVIQRLHVGNTSQAALPKRKINQLAGEKAEKLENYVKLKLLADSLLATAVKINNAVEVKNKQPLLVPVVRKITSKVSIDTIKSTPRQPRRRKLFGRIFQAFSRDKSEQAINEVIEQKKMATVVRQRIDTLIETTVFVPQQPKVHIKNYQQLFNANNGLKAEEKQLLNINNHLLDEIINNLKKYKIAEQNYINAGKTELDNNLYDVVFRFKSLSSFILLFLISLVIIILYNIWKIFRNERQLISYSEKAEQYALSKSAFLASMSHEIRTPLNSVIGFSEQLSQGDLDHIQQEQVNAISTSSKMLLEVVNEILDFSKFETGKMSFDNQPFNVKTILTETFNSMRIQAETKGIALIMDLDKESDICLKGDAFRLKQVVLNFLSNAIKFTAQGTVCLQCRISAGRPGLRVMDVMIKDSGLGISKEHIPLIFGEFSQVDTAQHKASQKGTGLGLAISKKIIELQGGEIKVTSEPGKGSEFSFKLSLEEVEDVKCMTPAESLYTAAAQDLNGKKMLIAEDNKLNVLLLTTILKKSNISYDVAEDGVEALTLFEANDYDLLLTDIEMPQLNGMELSKLIRQHTDQTKACLPILALTANVLKEDRDKYLQAGINGVVSKPFSEKNLLDTIASSLKYAALIKTEELN